MKRTRLFLLLILPFSFLAAGCSSTPEVVTIPYGKLYDEDEYGNNHFKSIGYSDLSSLVSNEDNFFLVVRGASADCLCWTHTRDNLSKYCKYSNLEVNYMGIDDFSCQDYLSLNLTKNKSTIAVFEKGQVKYQCTFSEEDEIGKDYATLASWISTYAKVGSILSVNKKQLDALYEGEVPFVVGFSRSTCSDCSYLNNHHLRDLGASSLYKRSYLFDCDIEGVRLYNGKSPDKDGDEDEKQAYSNWVAFKDEYGLSNTINEEFGYKEGYVPTFTYNLPNLGKAEAVRDMVVWGNDAVNKDGDNYKITDSYFSSSRTNEFLSDETILEKAGVSKTNLVGLTLKEDEVNDYGSFYSWSHEASAVYEDPLLTAFFSFYLAE